MSGEEFQLLTDEQRRAFDEDGPEVRRLAEEQWLASLEADGFRDGYSGVTCGCPRDWLAIEYAPGHPRQHHPLLCALAMFRRVG